MNEYLSKTGMTLLNEISSEIALLVSEAEKYGIQQYICIMGGLTKECLDEMRNSKVSEASEFIALCEVIINLAEKPGMERLSDLAKMADKLQIRWMDKRYRQIINSQNIVNELVKVSDKSSEAEFLCNYHFFLDASSLCSEQMPIFLDKLLPTLLDYKNPIHITVPQAVVNCLKELSADAQQAELTRAHNGMIQLRRIKDVGLLSIRGDEGDATLMSTFLAAFSRFKPKYHMVLITQDAALANAVYLLNASGVEGNDILISSLQEDGILALWFAEKKDSGEVLHNDVNFDQKNEKDINSSIEDRHFEMDSVPIAGEMQYNSKDQNKNDDKYNKENDSCDEEEDDCGEEEDEQIEDDILSEDVLEKIIDINRLLAEGEEDHTNSDDAARETEIGTQNEEDLDDLEALEEESLVLDSQIESDYEDTDVENDQYCNAIKDFREDKQENAEEGVPSSSWSTLE